MRRPRDRTTRALNAALALAALLVGASPATADDKVRVRGLVAASYEARERVGPEAEVELRMRTRRVQGVRAVLKVEARHFRDDVTLEDAYLDYKVSPRLVLQVGVNKKRLGMEYEQSRRERRAPERSFLYQKLEVLGIVGRQLNVRALAAPSPDVSFDLTAGTDGNRDINGLVRLAHQRGAFGYGVWALVEARHLDQDYLAIWAYALSLWHRSPRHHVVAELISGVDSFETELERTFADGRRVYFVGPKLELASRFRVHDEVDLEPLLQSCVVVNDVRELAYNTVQVLGGLNVHFRGAVLALTAQYLGRAERRAPHDRRVTWPNVYVELKYLF